jgi:tetratricopeptide (TPR) repeat protein
MKKTIYILLISAVCSADAVSFSAGGSEDLSSCKQGWGATEAGDHATAISLFNACIKNGNLSEKTLARTYRNLGIAHRRNNEPRKAIEYFNKALALRPASPWDDYVNRGNAWSDLGEYKNALKDYDLAFKSKPDYNEAYFNRGIVFERQNQLEKAKAEFVKAYEQGLRSELLYDRFVKYGLVK